MKKIFDEDLSLSELKSMMKRWRKKDNMSYIWLGALGVLLLVAVIALVVTTKMRCCCDDDFEDFDFDDDDDDDDFED